MATEEESANAVTGDAAQVPDRADVNAAELGATEAEGLTLTDAEGEFIEVTGADALRSE